VRGSQTLSTVNSAVNYSLDAAGNLSSDGLRAFAYDATNRHTSTRSPAGADTATVQYLFDALGQRVFKSTVALSSGTNTVTAATTPMPTLGQFYSYADDSDATGSGGLPSYALLGEYCNGASGCVQQEYLWLPLDNGQAIPIGMLRSSRLYAIHTDHLGTPRLIHDDSNTPVWQWAYSAFGENAPTGALKATTNVNAVFALGANNAKLALSAPSITVNLRFAGQYADSETGLFYNYFRSYQPNQGRYSQNDPIGLDGGWNRYVYAGANALSNIDPRGLDNPGMGPYGPYWTGVQVCSRPVNISWVGGANAYLPQHNWVQTGTYEAGMGAQCPIPGQGCSDTPGAQTQTINHSGQSADPSATCRPIPNVDEQCVSNAIRPGQQTGRWMPWNQCQSFAQSVIERCTTNGTNRPFIGYPRP
jgi:RHS repeat-associated protein